MTYLECRSKRAALSSSSPNTETNWLAPDFMPDTNPFGSSRKHELACGRGFQMTRIRYYPALAARGCTRTSRWCLAVPYAVEMGGRAEGAAGVHVSANRSGSMAWS